MRSIPAGNGGATSQPRHVRCRGRGSSTPKGNSRSPRGPSRWQPEPLWPGRPAQTPTSARSDELLQGLWGPEVGRKDDMQLSGTVDESRFPECCWVDDNGYY